jgi:hypothetical protein
MDKFILPINRERNLPIGFMPDDLVDFESFIKVGSMDNFRYIGGLTGLIGGLIYTLTQWKKMKKNEGLIRELEKKT